MRNMTEQPNEGLLEGRNAVTEALKAGRTIDKVFLASGDTDSTLRYIASLAKKSGAVVTYCDRRKLDAMSQTGAHQGVIAMAAAVSYSTVEDMLSLAESRGEAPLIVICDEISDPHNLGAIIRTADCAGAHGVIIPKRRNSGLTAVVAKSSAGAMEYLPIAPEPAVSEDPGSFVDPQPDPEPEQALTLLADVYQTLQGLCERILSVVGRG